MAFILPETAIPQPDETARSDSLESLAKSYAWKGPYTQLETAAKNIEQGDAVGQTGWVVSSWSLRRTPGDYGVLTVECTPPNPEGEEDPETGQKPVLPLEDVWSIRSVRNDISIFTYCGPSATNASRAEIEAWMKEPDGSLAEAYSYRDGNGIVHEIDNQLSLQIIRKIQRGVEAVIRFYPVVTRRRVYASVPPACLENLARIDKPRLPGNDEAARVRKPGGLSDAIDAHQWLKVQDDADQQTDGKWMRTESWMGIPLSDDADDSPWDVDFYGTDAQRWKSPLSLGES